MRSFPISSFVTASRADQGPVHDPLAGHRVLAGQRICKAIVCRQPIGDLQQPPHGCNVGFAFRDRIEPARVGKGIEVERAVKAVLADLVKQFEGRA